jgi:DNA-binding NtrC family response regulator
VKTLKTVVVIDDDPAELFLTGKELLDYHPTLEIYSFTSIKDGMVFLQGNHNRIGAVFIDLYLQGRIKSTEYLDDIKQFAPLMPIVILTFSQDPQDILEAYKHKILKYIIKPLTPSKLDQLKVHL